MRNSFLFGGVACFLFVRVEVEIIDHADLEVFVCFTGRPPSFPFSRDAAILAGEREVPPIDPPLRPSKAAAACKSRFVAIRRV